MTSLRTLCLISFTLLAAVVIAPANALAATTMDQPTYQATSSLLSQLYQVTTIEHQTVAPENCVIPGAPTSGVFPLLQLSCQSGTERNTAIVKVVKCFSVTSKLFNKCVAKPLDRLNTNARQYLGVQKQGSAALGYSACATTVFQLADAQTALKALTPLNTAVRKEYSPDHFISIWSGYQKVLKKLNAHIDYSAELSGLQANCQPQPTS